MRTCRRCGETKPIADFPLVRRGEEKRQTWCRACFAAVNAAYYARNLERERARVISQTTRRRTETRRMIIEYLLAHPCVDCGERDIVVLEFDHRGEKIGDVSTYANSGRPWPRVLGEIEKCDVRCANCHRRETARRSALAHRPRTMRPRVPVQLDIESALLVRICRVCGIQKSLAEFPLRSAATGVRHHICLSCQRQVTTRWYATSVGRPVRAQRRGATSRDALAAQVFSYLIAHPCVDCAEADPIVLDFDHRRDKVADIATLVRSSASWDVVQREIAKCDVRCANCHRRKTVATLGGYRLGA